MGLGGGLVEEVSDPKFSTAVGLVLYGMRPEVIGGTPFNGSLSTRNGSAGASGGGIMEKITSRMKAWFDEL
jgi:cell division protein FtsA